MKEAGKRRIRLINNFDMSFSKQGSRYIVFFVVIVLTFSVLTFRLWDLQIRRGSEYRTLAHNNRLRERPISPSRGWIFDRKGRLLVTNRPFFSLSSYPESDKRRKDTFYKNLVNFLVKHDRKDLAISLSKKKVTKINLDWEDVLLLETYRYKLPGIMIEASPRRAYLFGKTASHVLGYLAKITEKQLKSGAFPYNLSQDYVGQYGLEKSFHKFLNGYPGILRLEVDAFGRVVREIDKWPARPGNNLYITLDIELQSKAEELLKDKRGAIVAMDPTTGDILAMASSPSFDPNKFVFGISKDEWRSLINDPAHPFQNRCIQGLYPPGSTYKPLIAIAALSEHIVSPHQKLYCRGSYSLGKFLYRCWKKGGHGEVDIHRAIVESCDVYFYQLGLKLGVDRIAKYAHLWGFGELTGIPLPGEKRGIVPTSLWKLRRYHEHWQKGENALLAIGQGYNLVTPLQLCCFYAAIANNGRLMYPRIATKVVSWDGKLVKEFPVKIKRLIPISPYYLKIIQDALRDVVASSHGTAHNIYDPNLPIFGKTGTAQVVGLKRFEKVKNIEKIPYMFRDHAWFCGYAKKEGRTIVVTALVEHGGHGSSSAAPIVYELIKSYLLPHSQDRIMANKNMDYHEAG